MSSMPHQNLLQVKPVHEKPEHSEHTTPPTPPKTLEGFFAGKVHSGNAYVFLVFLIIFGVPAAYLSWRWNKGASGLWRWICVIFAFFYNIGYLITFALIAHEASLDNPKWDVSARASYNTTSANGLLGVQRGGAKKSHKK